MHILAILSRLDLARQETFLRHTKTSKWVFRFNFEGHLVVFREWRRNQVIFPIWDIENHLNLRLIFDRSCRF